MTAQPVELVLDPVLTRPDGRPRHSLMAQAAEWTYENLLQPDGPNAGNPWDWTDEQLDFLEWWWAVDDDGRWIFPRGMLERMKGWGKDPVGAALSYVELAGPSRFIGWDDNGKPIGGPHSAPWVNIAAVSKEQTENTMRLLGPMAGPQFKRRYGIDIGKEIVYAKAIGGMIKAVTSSPLALEGGRPTFFLRNETQNWFKNNGGHAMADVIERNIAKARGGGARLLDICNAPEPGEDSVAEQVWESYEKIVSGKSRGRGLMMDSREAPPLADFSDPGLLSAALIAARGDSDWLDVRGIMDLIYDPKTHPSTSRRFYLNQKVAPEDAWTNRQDWDMCDVNSDQWGRPSEERTLIRIMPKDQITLGFDGSKTDDATALVACRVLDGLLDPIKIWEIDPKEREEGAEIDREDVDEHVALAFEKFKVVAFYADVQEFESYVDDWSRKYGPRLKLKASPRSAVGWDMRQRGQQITLAAENMEASIRDHSCPHTGDRVMRRHVLNAKRRTNRWGTSFGKEHRESSRKVDALAGAVLARMARMDLYAKGRVSVGGKAAVMSW